MECVPGNFRHDDVVELLRAPTDEMTAIPSARTPADTDMSGGEPLVAPLMSDAAGAVGAGMVPRSRASAGMALRST